MKLNSIIQIILLGFGVFLSAPSPAIAQNNSQADDLSIKNKHSTLDMSVLQGDKALEISSNQQDMIDINSKKDKSLNEKVDDKVDEDIYVDNFMESSSVDKNFEKFKDDTNTEGNLRRVSIDVFFGQSKFNDTKNTEKGAKISGSLVTDNWGIFSFDLMGTQLEGQSGNFGNDRYSNNTGTHIRGTIWQRDFFLTNNILMNNTFGVTQSIGNSIMSNQKRFFFPSISFMGAKFEASSGQDKYPLIDNIGISVGKAGRFTGGRFAGFEKTQGDIKQISATGGRDDWYWGANVLQTQGLIFDVNNLSSPYENYDFPIKSTSSYIGLGRKLGQWQIQLNTIQSQGVFNTPSQTNETKKAMGVWAEADYNPLLSPWSYSAGAFSFEDNLLWGAFPVISNTQGAFARATYQKRRMQFGLGVDRIKPATGEGFDGWYSSSYARYQKDPLLAYGGSLALRSYNAGGAYSLQLYTDRRNKWGQARLSGEYASSWNQKLSDDSWQLSAEQSWSTKKDYSWSIMTSYGQWSGQTMASIGSSGTIIFGEDTKLYGVARFYHNVGDTKAEGNDIQISLEHSLTNKLSTSLSWYQSRGFIRSPFNLDPLFQEDIYSHYRDKTVYLSVSYDFQAGLPTPILSKHPRAISGAGDIEGVVFLDANSDGIRQANEETAPGVQVVLNNIYVAETDEYGVYRFKRVVTGQHSIKVISDNLPLPWQSPKQQAVEVSVRQTTVLLLGALIIP